MIYILESVCSDYALSTILVIIKRVLTVIQIFVPIIVIISVTLQLIKKVLNPDGDKDSMKKILNSFMAAIIVVFLPFIMNLVMNVISQYGDVGISDGNNFSILNVTSCFNEAGSKQESLDSSFQKSKSTIDEEKERTPVSIK